MKRAVKSRSRSSNIPVRLPWGRHGSAALHVAAGFLALIVGAGCAARRGPTQPAPAVIDSWSFEGIPGRRLVSDHYETFSTIDDPEFEQALPGFLEECYHRYQETLPFASPPSSRFIVYVFGTRAEWSRFSRARYPERVDLYSRIRTGGFAEAGTSVSFYADRSLTLATLAHEGWHLYVDAHLGDAIPAWLNEGLATCHEAVEWSGDSPTFTPTRNSHRLGTLREAVHSGQLLALYEVVTSDAGSALAHDEREMARRYYAQAWALIMFLRQGDPSRAAAFDGLLRDLSGGTFTARVSAVRVTAADGRELPLGEAAFRAYFGADPAELEDEYRAYVLQLADFVAIGE